MYNNANYKLNESVVNLSCTITVLDDANNIKDVIMVDAYREDADIWNVETKDFAGVALTPDKRMVQWLLNKTIKCTLTLSAGSEAGMRLKAVAGDQIIFGSGTAKNMWYNVTINNPNSGIQNFENGVLVTCVPAQGYGSERMNANTFTFEFSKVTEIPNIL